MTDRRRPAPSKTSSEGGAAMQASTNFKPGNQLRIDFRLTGAFSIGSEICWCDNNGCSGLRFLRLCSRAQLGSLATNRCHNVILSEAADSRSNDPASSKDPLFFCRHSREPSCPRRGGASDPPSRVKLGMQLYRKV